MKYIYITYDALCEFASNRFFQSSEHEQGLMLSDFLRGHTKVWNDERIKVKEIKDGCIFHAYKCEKERGLLLDMTKLTCFDVDNPSRIVNVFQIIVKCAVRYFDGERQIPKVKYNKDRDLAVIFPDRFVATHDGYKILVDLNTSREARRQGYQVYTAFYSGTARDVRFDESFTKKVIDILKSVSITCPEPERLQVNGLKVSELQTINKSIDENIGLDAWKVYLTKNQREFVDAEVNGPERLEGAAGTGKTISMILRCINILMRKIEEGESYHIIFVTHSLATKDRIMGVMRINWPDFDNHVADDVTTHAVSITVTTLQEWSASHLGTNQIYDSEYLDKDASASKELQYMAIAEEYDKVYKNTWQSFRIICSPQFVDFIEKTEPDAIVEMLQQEIAVIIKGRAKSSLDKYKKLKRTATSLPLYNDNDKAFVFSVFASYQKRLEDEGKFDSDDIILTALGQLSTPIWARRSSREGYDACFIDETHLFNLNELNIFHYLNKPEKNNNIVFAIDKSQAIIDFGNDDEEIAKTFNDNQTEQKHQFATLFRCSPDIAHLALDIITSGVSFFKTFVNPFIDSSFSFTAQEEKKCEYPEYHLSNTVDDQVENAFEWIQKYGNSKGSQKSKLAIIATSAEMLKKLEDYAQSVNKGYVVIKSRSDSNAVMQGTGGHMIVIGHIDYVGGLEFDAVAIVGVDAQSVPPVKENQEDAYHSLSFMWHNLMYVAVTRAQYALAIYGLKAPGPSPILQTAIKNESLKLLS